MNSSICTLFEGHYHYGLVGLVNSLYINGYRGSVFAGYRGNLPEWASESKENESLKWKGARTFKVADDMQLHFLPLDTDYHFANYKPDFMLELWKGPASNAKNLFYFDPDIVVVKSWPHFDEWANCGIALCEDVNSPIPMHHPRRVAWRRFFVPKGISLKFSSTIYANSGFIGLSIENIAFVEIWKQVQETIGPLIGGLNKSMFNKGHHKDLELVGGPFMPFLTADQDALNIATGMYEKEISFIGKEGMGFVTGSGLMLHAIGVPKPWNWKPLIMALDGRTPRKVDIEFWRSMKGPINMINKLKIFSRIVLLKSTIAIGRFYSRN